MKTNYIKKFAEHYNLVDRSFGQSPIYDFNDKLFIFGREKNFLIENFNKWNNNKMFSVSDFLFNENGIAYLTLHKSWYDKIKHTLPSMWVIHAEEVDYGFFIKKS